MAFIDDEGSIRDSAPIELYEFIGPSASFEYRYTSYESDYVFGGDTYVAEPIRRSAVVTTGAGDPPVVSLDIPADKLLVRNYAFQVAPRSLTLTIHRVQAASGESVQWWKGVVSSINVKGDWATLRCESILDSALAVTLPQIRYQTLCNHKLYDPRCGLTNTDFDLATTVSSISADELTINVASVGGAANDAYKGGYIVRDTDGESRLITRQLATALIIQSPFRTLVAADAVTLFLGCDHLVTTCRDKFDNVVNFGGHPNIPWQNLWESKLTDYR